MFNVHELSLYTLFYNGCMVILELRFMYPHTCMYMYLYALMYIYVFLVKLHVVFDPLVLFLSHKIIRYLYLTVDTNCTISNNYLIYVN